MKIFIGSCVWREVNTGHMQSLIPLLRQPGVSYGPQVGDALIERARGVSATYFLNKTDADIHLSIDSDITGFLPASLREYGVFSRRSDNGISHHDFV